MHVFNLSRKIFNRINRIFGNSPIDTRPTIIPDPVSSSDILSLDISSPTPQPESIASPEASSLILDSYVKSAPDPQNALDIFQGEWSSKFPAPFDQLSAGSSLLFDDARIQWFVEEIGGINGKSILELGPLEGGHTYLLEKFGAGAIIAIESNTRSYLKCLIVKELLKLQKANFLCGDFVEYLGQEGESFEACLASGVLYHMQKPAELIALLTRRCSQYIFLWTHYYDHQIISTNPNLAHKFSEPISGEYQGFKHQLYRQEYKTALGWSGFCGGNAPISYWMNREDILDCLRYFGFEDLRINFDHPKHPNGPAFAITAIRYNQKK